MNLEIFRFDNLERMHYEAESRHRLYSTSEFSEAFLSRFNDLAGSKSILSFDIFDTFLIRDDSSELQRFVEIGALLAKEAGRDPIDGFFARYLGTKASYRAGRLVDGCGEGSLKEIHKTACRILGLADRMSDVLIEIELKYEAERLSVNPLLNRILDDWIGRGRKAILISDMYMHADQLGHLLRQLGVETNRFELIISSADTKVSKASGRIFHEVEKRLGAKPSQFFHIGDSLKGDYIQPRAAGWSALHLPIPHREILKRRESHLSMASMLLHDKGHMTDIAVPN